jgi:hypothetical protein
MNNEMVTLDDPGLEDFDDTRQIHSLVVDDSI